MELARNLRKDPVSRLAPPEPLTVERTATVGEAVELMRKENAGCVLICDSGQLVGLFTERDLMRRVLAVGKPLSLPIEDVMTPEVVSVNSRDPIRLAVRRMGAGGHRHLPVIDEGNRPIGIVSVKGVVRFLAEHYPGAVYNQPPAGQIPDKPEGA